MSSLWRIWKFIKPYWKDVVIAVVTLVLVVIFDLMIPSLTQRAIDDGIMKSDLGVVLSSTLLMLGFTLVSALFSFVNSVSAVRSAQKFTYDLRNAIFRKIQALSFGNYDHLTTGEMLVSLTSDVSMVQNSTMMMMRMAIRAPIMLFGSLFFIFTTNAKLSLMLLPVMLLHLAVVLVLMKPLQKFFTEVQKRLDKLNTVMQENLSGVRVVKAFVRQKYEIDRFGVANGAYAEQNVKAGRLMSGLFPLLFTLGNIGTVMVIYFGGIQVTQGSMTTGEVVAFINYLMMTMFPMFMLAMLVGMLASAGASAGRIEKILDAEIEVRDKPGAVDMPKIQGAVEFQNVTFAYRGSEADPVLKQISFAVNPGETVAILGATGSGKSSLVNLIPRLYDVTEGQILIDGRDIRDVKQSSLQAQIGIALQEAILFSGTVADNIRYGRPEATDDEVREAAIVAEAHDFVMEFEEGYQYHVGQRGSNLSGGQKQRLSIARAICMDPAILILDDSTSAVDVDTEARIQEKMDAVLKGRTSFIIAQRISTVLNADKILVLEDGTIVDTGTHKELIQRCEVYREIYDSQLGNGNGGGSNVESK
ncbi:MAG: ABC transporter ATP-binding protein [Anaerolineaceae bacterium]|nr:ABC transporter ATP-binding protein [Anaerolineaceae bacterium]